MICPAASAPMKLSFSESVSLLSAFFVRLSYKAQYTLSVSAGQDVPVVMTERCMSGHLSNIGVQIARERTVSFTIKRKDNTIKFHTDFIFPKLIVFGCLFNGTAGNGDAFVVHLAMIFLSNTLSVTSC